jgi:hypothetical protein
MGNNKVEEFSLAVSHSSALISFSFMVMAHYMKQAVDDKGKKPFIEMYA